MPEELEDLNPLEILLLLCVRSGMATAYNLRSRIGVGVGASSPALKRLEENKLLAATPGPRNRVRFTITAAGDIRLQDALDDGPRHYWKHGRRETFDSLLRAIFFAWTQSRVEDGKWCVAQAVRELYDLARNCAYEAVHARKTVSRMREDLERNADSIDNGEFMAAVYRLIASEMEALQFRLQAEAAKHLEGIIDDLPPTPKFRTRSAPRN